MKNRTNTSLSFYVCVLFSLLFISQVSAQTSNTISGLDISDAIENRPVTIIANLLVPEVTTRVQLAYRPLTESEFIVVDMEVIGNKASYTIPADEVKIPSLTYYLTVSLSNGTTETYPMGIPDRNDPLELVVGSLSDKEKEVIILNPEPGETVAVEDLFISVSFIRASDDVDVAATKIYLNDEDISDKVLIAGDLILFYAANFPGTVTPGNYTLTVEVFDNSGEPYHTYHESFTAKSEVLITEEEKAFSYRGNFKAESRNENFNEASKWYNNFTTDLNGTYDDWKFRGYAFLTSEEDSKLQPRHRFFAQAESDWLQVRAGDTYPLFPQMILNGKRVRGVRGNLELGFFNVLTVYGETKRSVKGELIATYSSEDVPLQSNIISLDETKYGAPYGEINAGTFKRDLFAIRPSFGSGENFQLGFTYLHGADDPNSIDLGGTPKENVVLGTDMILRLDDRNIEFRTSAAVSLINNDISTGELSDSEIDSVFGGDDAFIDVDPQTIKDVKNILGSFITVNQNIGPLNPQKLSSLSSKTSLKLNYLYNTVKASYVYRGNEYNSFGQDFLRKDVQGINIVDRIRMWDNRIFFTLGFESLSDNLQKTKFATTKDQTYNAAVSIFPRMNFPNITISYTSSKKFNDISITDTTKNLYLIDYLTDRISTNFSYSFGSKVRHNTSLNIASTVAEDNSITNYDSKSLSTSYSLNSYWTRDLTSFVNLIYFNSEIAQQKYKYFTLSLGARYRMLEDKLELRATIRPSFGDLDQQDFIINGDYEVIRNLFLALQFRIIRRAGLSTDSISGLTVRYSI